MFTFYKSHHYELKLKPACTFLQAKMELLSENQLAFGSA
jgi:hypothetical protein